MILDGALGCAGDEDEPPRPGSQGLFDGVLNEWLIDDRQHLLGTCLGRRKKARAAPGHRENSRTNSRLQNHSSAP